MLNDDDRFLRSPPAPAPAWWMATRLERDGPRALAPPSPYCCPYLYPYCTPPLLTRVRSWRSCPTGKKREAYAQLQGTIIKRCGGARPLRGRSRRGRACRPPWQSAQEASLLQVPPHNQDSSCVIAQSGFLRVSLHNQDSSCLEAREVRHDALRAHRHDLLGRRLQRRAVHLQERKTRLMTTMQNEQKTCSEGEPAGRSGSCSTRAPGEAW